MLKGPESTLDSLYPQIAQVWHQQDDMVYSFDDRRYVHIESIWTFDLNDDLLRCDKQDCNLQIPLSLLRSRAVTMSDFEPYEPPTTSEPALDSIFPPPCWRMKRKGLDSRRQARHMVFISRILAEFALQWEYILGGRYNDATFRKLASAVIRIATLDFDVEEIMAVRHRTGGGLVTWISHLPEWEPLRGNIFRVGGASIVMCQHIENAKALIREDFEKRGIPQDPSRSSEQSLTYLILSVKHVMLCRINWYTERYTTPKRLFDGTNPPSDEAVELLLEATQTDPITTFISKFPTELQDLILDFVSVGRIERARVGCILDVGSNFRWEGADQETEREMEDGNRLPEIPVASHICFGGRRSGVAYY